MHSGWRRFVPKKSASTTLPASHRVTVASVDEVASLIDHMRHVGPPAEPTQRTEYFHKLLLAQTPRAVLAQIQMDEHKHGYHDREKRLFELIDFNDTFVALILSLKHNQLPGYADQLKADMTQFCQHLGTPMFSDGQFDAIVRGLSREIAVYRAALHEGFRAEMTNRVDDAFGIDMVITQPGSGKKLYIDCKTPPAFRHRLEELLKEGKITETDLLKADENDFITTEHRHQERRVMVTLLCLRPDTVGEVTDFIFNSTKPLADLLNKVFTTV
jgi:hypothetical protein